MKGLFLLFTILLISFATEAKDKPFQGKIIYEIDLTGEDAGMLSMVMFSHYTYYFGDEKMRLNLEGGMAYLLGDFVFNKGTGETVMLDDFDKIVYDLTSEEETVEEESTIEVVKTKEKEKILGYKCFMYEVTTTTDGDKTMSQFWVTDNINPNVQENMDMGNDLFIAGLDGFPLKIVTEVEGIVMTQTATEVSEEVPDAQLFVTPQDYEAKDFSESPLMRMLEEDVDEKN